MSAVIVTRSTIGLPGRSLAGKSRRVVAPACDAMQLRICVADRGVTEIMVLQSGCVRNIKAQLAQQHGNVKLFLVYGGHVLSDDTATLHELGIIDGCTVWALRPSEVMSSTSTALWLQQTHRICPLPREASHSTRAHQAYRTLSHAFVGVSR